MDARGLTGPGGSGAGGAAGSRTLITAAEGLLAIEPVLVGPEDPLDVVIRRAGAAPATRVLGVVDAEGILVGVVSSHDLVASIVGRLAPASLLAEVRDVEGVSEFDRVVEAEVAADLMRPPAALTETATMGEAFRLMHERGLSGTYVVDAAGRPVGYVDGLELAAAIVGRG